MSDLNSSADIREAIQTVIRSMMDRVLHKVLNEDPFLPDKFRDEKPLYAALVPDEIFKGSHFERRFVTPFGKAWQDLAVVAAASGLGHGETERRVSGLIREGRLQRIAEVLNRLEHDSRPDRFRSTDRIRPDWSRELEYVMAGGGVDYPVDVICDVYAEDVRSGLRYAFEIKAPLPNSDITKVSKEKILKLHAMEPRLVDGAYFALPYNPYGTRSAYSWSFPARWFDMRHDEVVLIGDEFWEKVGGTGTYQAFITAVNEIGLSYRERIYREYLGMVPPDDMSAVLR